jgi:multidrug efflux pump subunit AcrA (membrane-fusion protein)
VPWFRRRHIRIMLAGIAAVALAGLALAYRAGQTVPSSSAFPTEISARPAAHLIAHGIVQPAVTARVATQSGGVVQTLAAIEGDPVSPGRELATIRGPVGPEILTAPFAGTVTSVSVHVGDTLIPGSVVATVGDLSRYVVETLDVDEYLAVRVYPGQEVSIVVDAIGGDPLAGIVERVALQPQESPTGARVYPVTINALSPTERLRPGLRARLTFRE